MNTGWRHSSILPREELTRVTKTKSNSTTRMGRIETDGTLQIAPTRSNLLRMREALKLAREGYEILDKKREVLTSELIHVAHDAAALQERVWAMLADAYQALTRARLSMGREHLEWTALSVNKTTK